MKNILRSAVLVAAFATTAVMGTTSANAAGAGAFTGDVTLQGFGVGASQGSARLCVSGVVNGAAVVNPSVCTSVTGSAGANVTANFTLNEPSASCPATGTASGTFSGAVSGGFTWSRVGVVAVISTTGGDLDGGSGVAAFAVTDPPGNPCGTPTSATVKATTVGVLVDPS